jgi:hypothetical protein
MHAGEFQELVFDAPGDEVIELLDGDRPGGADLGSGADDVQGLPRGEV